jgi:hypothetical protein
LAGLIASNSELFTEQQFYLQCKTKTAKLLDSKKAQELKNRSQSKGRVSELRDGVRSDLRQWLRSRIAVYGAYWTAVDETAGVASVGQSAVSV